MDGRLTLSRGMPGLSQATKAMYVGETQVYLNSVLEQPPATPC